MHKDCLTSEKLKALFPSNFELANYAMRLAHYKISSGQEVNVEDLLRELLSQTNRQSIEELDKKIADLKASKKEEGQQHRHQEERR